jgi:asparagine synthase (glutamine-hydrolysing)
MEHLAYGQLFFGECRRGRVAALVHPLISQPLVELCLAIPADVLADGPDENLLGRGLARKVFAGRLPAEVARRLSKGDMTAFHGQAIAASLGDIRPFLIDGRLAAQGIVDRDRLGGALTVEALMREGGYADVLDLLAIEAWVRVWEARLDRLAGVQSARNQPPPAPAADHGGEGGPIKGARKSAAKA